MSVSYHVYPPSPPPPPPPPPPQWHHPVHPWADLQNFIAIVLFIVCFATVVLLHRHKRELTRDERDLVVATNAVLLMCASVVIHTDLFLIWLQVLGIGALMITLALRNAKIRKTFLPWTK